MAWVTWVTWVAWVAWVAWAREKIQAEISLNLNYPGEQPRAAPLKPARAQVEVESLADARQEAA